MSSAMSGSYEAEYLFWDIKALNVHFQTSMKSLVLTRHLKESIYNSMKKIIQKKTMEIWKKVDKHISL